MAKTGVSVFGALLRGPAGRPRVWPERAHGRECGVGVGVEPPQAGAQVGAGRVTVPGEVLGGGLVLPRVGPEPPGFVPVLASHATHHRIVVDHLPADCYRLSG